MKKSELKAIIRECLHEELAAGKLNEELMLEGVFSDKIKKVATRIGADAATILRCFGEIIGGKAEDVTTHIENKAALKALQSGNKKTWSELTQDDIEDLVKDIAEYEESKKNSGKDKTMYDVWCTLNGKTWKALDEISEKEADESVEGSYAAANNAKGFKVWKEPHVDGYEYKGNKENDLEEGIFGFGKKKTANKNTGNSGGGKTERDVTFTVYDPNGTVQFKRTFTELPGKMSAAEQFQHAFRETSAYNKYKNNNPYDWQYERVSVPEDTNWDTKYRDKPARNHFVSRDLNP